jgi:hypothetical protein
MTMRLLQVASLVAGFGMAGSLVQGEGLYRGYETPPWVVERMVGPAELRSYGTHLVAEVTVAGDRNGALGQGFRLLAGYIFGGNAAGQEVAMTSPVAQAPADQGWTVRFSMPSAWTLDSLPAPRDDAIRLVEVPAERQIVLTFSGRTPDSVLAARSDELRALAEGAGLTITAGPFFYYYDDPFTLPWNRRNEVAFAVQD